MNVGSNVRGGFALLTVLIALGACSGKRISDIDEPTPAASSSGPAWSVPDGVAVTPDERGSLDIDGLYPSTVPNDRRCCWIAPVASVRAREPAAATTLVLTVLVPDYPFFEAHAQSLSVRAGGTSANATGLAPGVHRIDVALKPAERRTGILTIGLRTTQTFVPAHENVNSDTRELGVILLGISFR